MNKAQYLLEILKEGSSPIEQLKSGKILINMRDGYRIAFFRGKFRVSPAGKGDFDKFDTDEKGVTDFMNSKRS